ncbi:hypothetical protein Ac2012v2_007578 [Leucoagaricus gongylophorus]
MQFTVILPVLACVVATVHATPYLETNAARLARGLPPNPPVRRTGTAVPNGKPSSVPTQCNSGSVQCCNKTSFGGDPAVNLIARRLGIALPANIVVGLTCSPLSVIGIGGNNCNTQPVCCQNNNFNGLIAVGCNPSK